MVLFQIFFFAFAITKYLTDQLGKLCCKTCSVTNYYPLIPWIILVLKSFCSSAFLRVLLTKSDSDRSLQGYQSSCVCTGINTRLPQIFDPTHSCYSAGIKAFTSLKTVKSMFTLMHILTQYVIKLLLKLEKTCMSRSSQTQHKIILTEAFTFISLAAGDDRNGTSFNSLFHVVTQKRREITLKCCTI